MNPEPRLSVIVASYNSPATLEKCLESLSAQLDAEAEVIVADCSDRDPRLGFRRMMPGVRFLHFSDRLTIPQLRREALRAARGEIILLTEGRIVPSLNWAAALQEAHTFHPHAPAVGGPIECTPASARELAIFLCEYGQYMAPAADRECAELSGANLSYKRWALDLCADLVEAGAWETFLHHRLKQHGHRLRRAGSAVVCYHNSLSVPQFLRQRFHYGRWFAAARVRGSSPIGRLPYAGFCPLLPFLLTWRLARVVFRRRRFRVAFLGALPWVLLFQSAWSVGEFCGYITGAGSSDRQVF